MSRQIDLTKPLSDEDREYLLVRCRYNDLAINEQHLAGEEPIGLMDQMPPTDTSPADVPITPDASPADLGAQTPAEAPGGADPAAAADNGSAAASTEPSADSTEDNYDDESVWSYGDLKAEAEQANESLPEDQRIALNLSRSDMIAALRHFDATYGVDPDDEPSA